MHANLSATSVAIPDPGLDKEPAGDSRFELYKRAHLLLRGRYRYLLPLMCIFTVAGAMYGYRSRHPIYVSEGLIHITPRLPEVLQATDQNDLMSMYDEFVKSQVLRMTSRPVVDLAIADPQLKQRYGGQPLSPGGFAGDLFVENPVGSETILIDYLSPNPQIAAASVRALIHAYLATYQRDGQAEQHRRLEVLADRRDSLNLQISQITQQMQQTAIIPSAATIALHDDLMKSYMDEQARQQAGLDRLLYSDYGPNRPEVKAFRTRLGELDQEIEAYRQSYARIRLAEVMRPGSDRRETSAFPELKGLEYALDKLSSERDETVHRLDVLTTEANLGAERATVRDWGDVPAEPAIDHRRSESALCGLAGGLAPLLLFLAFGTVERRYRFSDQARESRGELPMLGMIPELSARMDGQESARIIEHCLHNVRIGLRAFGGSARRPVYAITSSTPGEGKTNVTLSLGFSFASSGSRTLLIDCDVIGQGLTHRLQRDNAPGLIDCLDHPHRANITAVSANLWLLPVGRADEFSEMAVTPKRLRELLDVARAEYDVVLIDTGPILASVEAAVATQGADSVILVIAQGQLQECAGRAIQALQSVGARMAGFVFNRAAIGDYYRSIGGAANAYYHSAKERLSAPSPAPAPGPVRRIAPQAVKPSASLTPAAAAGRPVVVSARGDGDVLTDIGTAGLYGTGSAVYTHIPAGLTFFSEEHLADPTLQPLPVVMTVINGPSAEVGDTKIGREGFAGRRPDVQMYAAPMPTPESAVKEPSSAPNA